MAFLVESPVALIARGIKPLSIAHSASDAECVQMLKQYTCPSGEGKREGLRPGWRGN